ncbi:olfactory receptor 4E1-like [Protopterus annectens]|uniref:olfactory receptor 4E1-like n=1 Tax=Protopterus annectens TaxID=7888 RepID=UPI001CFB62CD|nr:olfactory receptor 4E1-like [Protopterus annectens]
MKNISSITTLKLAGFEEFNNYRYFYFICCLLGYLLIVFINVLLIVVIIFDQNLHAPMYAFICNLALNGLYGSSVLFPQVVAYSISESNIISYAACFIQMFFVYSYSYNELVFLAIMAYDRYVSICNPLRYYSILTKAKTLTLVILSWIYSACFAVAFLCLSLRLPLCDKYIPNIFCDNAAIVKLSCVDTSFDDVFQSWIAVVNSGLMLIGILCSYVQIFKVCKKSSEGTVRKAFHTCITHMVAVCIFLICGVFKFFQRTVNKESNSIIVHILFSAGHFIFPPLLNPIIYGIRTQEIRNVIKKIITRKMNKFN